MIRKNTGWFWLTPSEFKDGVSEIKNKINLFCYSLDLHYLCNP